MKRTLTGIAFVVLSTGFVVPTRSQPAAPAAEKSELPKGELLRPAAEFSQWEITFVYSDEPKKGKASKKKPGSEAQNGRPRKIVTTKTGQIVHEERIDLAQQATDVWYDASSQYTRKGKNPRWYQSQNSLLDTNYHPLPRTGYRDLEFVKEENYVGSTSYEHRNCLVFLVGEATSIPVKKPGSLPKPTKSSVTAYVDAQTRVPVTLQTPTELRTYQMGPSPTKMQTLPADLLVQKQEGEEGRQRLDQPALQPY